ncbi:MAG: restriction endonuclease subunit S, partial [Bacteroidota bacterium]
MKIPNPKFIQNTKFSFLENWSVQYLIESVFSFNNKYQLVRIGDFLIRNKTRISIQDNMQYQRVTIKINNGGVIPRDIEVGSKIGTKQQYVISEGQFLMSKIDARNGAFGIVPPKLTGAIVTNDFPAFDVNSMIINPEFLVLIATTREFIKFAQSCSSGTTNRQRIDIDSFLNVKIPLPSLEGQNKIVTAYNDRIKGAKRLDLEAKIQEEGIETFLFSELGVKRSNVAEAYVGLNYISYNEIERWALSHLLKQKLYSFKNVKYPILPIKTLLTFFEGGKTPSTARKEFWNGDVIWTSAKDMKELFLTTVQDRITNLAVQESGLKIYPKGTILGVFRSGILRHSFPVALTQVETTINQDLKAMGVNEEIVLKDYILNYLNVFQKMILERSQK